jgi:hypothetical protein
MHVMRGDADDSDPSEPPPAGYTDDLSSVRAGSAVIAFYATEGLWYAATVNEVYLASEGAENGVVHDTYYWITFTGYADSSESVYAERIRVKKVVGEPERRLQAGPEPEPEAESKQQTMQKTLKKSNSLGRLFAAVDGDGDGDLDRAEVAALLRRERLDASDAHVDGIFDRCVRDVGVWWRCRGWVGYIHVGGRLSLL